MGLARLGLGNDPETANEKGQHPSSDPVRSRSKRICRVLHLAFLPCIVFLTNAITYTLIVPAPEYFVTL